ncbi:methyl-accepting chemotaxis protein McpC [Paenibacillus larvae subsp. larvae]|uniref:Methyl-accepting chemotaxis protein McpC n=1 Tax=Paenibacillus larvae subsp. larvae TaxID=147375 RepID=A0A2L1U3C8_9BACL|nr:methyl-accepting chemotaxis protein [Paenibacillus larvae]AQT84010.1 methyl-accepting chemotaxis protein [Paenibacillus larvae subsp. pulvifaciens]AQZ45471.1 methyl-accepting chemotaxis protein [Paenibacillus larvae subsp. pulvifaciens]AVF27445.1 methyl-accepting chemotaxis protein McpC [Paenibacillus larvae subsp. larvae]AVF32108.1 methyl-accepting chemotaxis protein McpC [Paenibacillus larvae subsp. larvae]MCY9499102.1 methyl-accepting chemotaxis protein [Paenibacillus larvae]
MNKKISDLADSLKQYIKRGSLGFGRKHEDNRGTGQKKKIRFVSPARSVSMKLFLVFFISILFFVLAVGTLSYIISQGVIQDKVSNASEQTIVQASEKLDVVFNTYDELSLQLFMDKEIQKGLTAAQKAENSSYEMLEISRDLNERLNLVLFSNKSLRGIALFDKDGRPITSTGISVGTAEKQTYSEEPWYKQAVENNGQATWAITRPKGYFSNSPAFALSRSLRDTSTNNVIGLIMLEIGVDVLDRQLEGLNLGDNGIVQLTDMEGNIAYSADKEMIGKKTDFKIPEKDINKSSASFLTDNNEEQVMFSRLHVSKWLMFGALPVSALVKDAGIILNVTIIMAVIGAALAGLIGWIVARMLGKPLQNVRRLMRDGAGGNLTVRANYKSRDEIGQLGQSFDEMMSQITELVQQTSRSAQEVLSTSGELAHASKVTAASAKEIGVATGEISNGAGGLAAESERGNELSHNIGKQMQQVIEANLEMGTAAAGVRSASEQGTRHMKNLRTKTNAAEETVRNMLNKVVMLNDNTRSIRKILDMLHNITKQTNILSLNATIEAARAGAAGKGFMVVADEIRGLAEQSKQSIDVVAGITRSIENEIDETVSTLTAAYPVFQEQAESVKKADAIFQQVQQQMVAFIEQLDTVSSSIHELDESQAVLSDAMTNVSAVAEESLATSEEVASLSTEQLNISEGLVDLSDKLEQLSNSLKDSLSKFKV